MMHGWKKAGRWNLLVLLLFSAGCSKSDPDILANIAHKVTDRTQLISDNIEQTWTKFLGRVVLESRVKTRLRWDKALAEVSIDVHATENAVELKGTVPTQAQAQRAAELAETTLGVEKVVNLLQVERQ